MVTLPVSFTGPYTEDEPNFPRQNNLGNFTEKGPWRRQGCEIFKDFSTDPIKKSSTFKHLNQIQGLFKTTSKI